MKVDLLNTIFGPLAQTDLPYDREEYQCQVELSGTLDFFGTPITVEKLAFHKTCWRHPAQSSFGDSWGSDGDWQKHVHATKGVAGAIWEACIQALEHQEKDIALYNRFAREGLSRELSAKAGK
jgi:hypothetical protein